LPDVNTGPLWMRRNALPGLPPMDLAYADRLKSELTRLPLAADSKRTPQSVQSSTMRFRTSARIFVETSGPRTHCFITHVWWIEMCVVAPYLRNIDRVFPARKHHCTVTSCAP